MLLSSTYFGNIAFWKEVMGSTKSNIEIDISEKFVKQTFRNRCALLSANGRLNLTIPVIRKNGSDTLIKDIEISQVENWQKDHWKAIESAYKHAPFFWYYGERIKELIHQDEKNLVQFNLNIINQISSWVSYEGTFSLSSDNPPITSSLDLRVSLNNKKQITNEKPYIQVFQEKFPFQSNLFIVDLLLNIGPAAYIHLINVK